MPPRAAANATGAAAASERRQLLQIIVALANLALGQSGPTPAAEQTPPASPATSPSARSEASAASGAPPDGDGELPAQEPAMQEQQPPPQPPARRPGHPARPGRAAADGWQDGLADYFEALPAEAIQVGAGGAELCWVTRGVLTRAEGKYHRNGTCYGLRNAATPVTLVSLGQLPAGVRACRLCWPGGQ